LHNSKHQFEKNDLKQNLYKDSKLKEKVDETGIEDTLKKMLAFVCT